MGDPRKIRKKYQKPSHPWQKERIEEEKALLREYGLKNKKEIWKVDSVLRNFKNQVKRLIAATTQQAEKEKQQLLHKLYNMSLIKRSARLDDVLGLTLNDIMNRRLQTIIYKKGFARTISQARQFIVHKHVRVGEKKINSPSYFVLKNEDEKISFSDGSSLFNPEHPERKAKEEKPKKTRKKVKKNERKRN